MTSESQNALYKVQEKMKESRFILDNRMYWSGECPDEDRAYLRRVYDAVCKVLDLL